MTNPIPPRARKRKRMIIVVLTSVVILSLLYVGLILLLQYWDSIYGA